MLRDKDKFEEALELSRQASQVKRFHTMHLNAENTVGQHTFNLLGILFMCVPPTALRWQLLAAAWQHDVAEAEAGDVPSPTKRALGGMDDFERKVLEDAGMHDMAGYLHAHELRWLKLADSLEGWMKCVQELRTGNTLILPAARNFCAYVTEKLADLGEHTIEELRRPSDETATYRSFRRLVKYVADAHIEMEKHYGTM
jgi:5'-deoxynucleotidase YfbR-like HD superfamily hydrolase